ncbi:nicotinate-nucleotide--dimethylbenzimidazole phosphoribosyltransferase [Streptomyces sp. NBC_00257]|uniref:nicotinate-nucleotide--dimethylbenzimidazole phosphoribosyltransferase n=1 Tax=unclassified Streptomyces TaxID=2593676 RepID=UPI00225ADC7C|nr:MULTISPECIES: nicotinate-nucleotide--dimethylbenzimidazole phosphoribosyltransferase [unclassified Streptomyces]WTB53248.1 nicotinate-nucleotide--dimethylbenzimidazole phosphoribosyltransferase [Streptomyces sp. NBC_00826]WTH93861.1 nicotinate-nucleotide--dimethylbenzimidazole phosphoribosyltransferase [Streptomyces sp. NBC_00825]WTI02596.1 nicotinate-nucleotide--dimethylbenzimidazole phosphoribosyltransferase [Streptomyces sp. NBC_00822]MCX4868243.1 nicotinate-nucleotide--dimethylbenzimidaz
MSDTGQIPVEGLPENAGTVEQPGVAAPDAYTYLAPSEHVSEDDDLLLMPSPQGAWSDPQAVPAPGQYPEGVAAQAPLPGQGAYQAQHVAQPYAQPADETPAQPQGPVQVQVQEPVQAQAAEAYAAQPAVAEQLPGTGQGTHESGGRDSGSVDLTGVRIPSPAPAAQPQTQTQPQTPPRRPLHRGPVVPDGTPSYGGAPTGGVVRSLADRGPAGAPQAQARTQAPARHAGPPTTGPEYFELPADDASALPGPQLGEILPQGGSPWGAQAQTPQPEAAPVAAESVVPEQTAPEQTVSEPIVSEPVVPEPVASEPVAESAPMPVPEAQAVQPAPVAAPEAVAAPAPVAGPVPAEAGTPAEIPAEIPAEAIAPQDEAEAVPMGQFVPVEGSVPTTPHLAPAPVAEDNVAAEPVAEPEPVPEAEVAAEPEPERVPIAMGPVAPVEPVAAEAVVEPSEPVEPAAIAEVVEPAVAPEAEAPAVSEPEPEQGPEVIETPDITPLAEAGEAVEAVPAAEPGPVDAAQPEAQPEALPAEALPAEVQAQEPAEVAPAPDLEPEAAEAEAQEAPDASDAPETSEASESEEAAAPAGPPAPGYDDAEREAVLRVMRERRDIRNGFRSDPIPHEVLLRVLEAAHTAPSVGHSQPWDFVVIRSAETRRSMHELAQRQRDAYAKSLPKGRAKQFKELKIEAILDTPVNIVVTADPTRGGRHTLGRHTQPQMAPYSSALAVENLWLAARAEGLGVGWVSFFDEREMVRALGLPEHLEVVAYLCVGYVDEFPEEPELMQAGWSKRRPLSWVVHEETYGRRALPGEEPHDLLQETISNIRPLDAKALGEAWERQKRMTKPAGALGMLEIISAQLSGLSRMCPPPIPEPAAVAIFAGDHGVHAQGVTAWPQEVTGQMVANFLGGGAVCNAFAAQVGAEVCVVDVGVAMELPATPGLLPRKVRAGTADFTTGPALTREEVLAAIEVGIETARDLVAAGNKGLLTGEMGIANTTASAALICVYTGMDPAEVTGRGTGINDEMHARKVDVVRRALELHQPDPADPIGVLAAVGGLEHAAMAGFLLGGASLRTPVILDGVSAGAAALVARAIAPEALAACIAGHRSAEPGHVAALNKLGLRPLVDLDLRLGEGTGALLALPIVQSAARAMHEVATFDSAGVTEK